MVLEELEKQFLKIELTLAVNIHQQIEITHAKMTRIPVPHVFKYLQTRALKPLYKTGLFFAPRTVLFAGVSAKVLTNPATMIIQQFVEYNKSQPESSKIQMYCVHP